MNLMVSEVFTMDKVIKLSGIDSRIVDMSKTSTHCAKLVSYCQHTPTVNV